MPPRASIATEPAWVCVGPDEVEDELGAAAPGQVAHGLDRLVRVDHVVDAELLCQAPASLVGLDRDDRARSQLAEKLHRDVPDASDADHDGARAGRGEVSQPVDGVIGREARVRVGRNGCGLDAGREADERSLGHEHEVREAAVDREAGELVPVAVHVVAAPARDAEPAAVRRVDEYGVAFRDGRDAGADLLDPACVLVAEDARKRDAGGLHQSLDRVQIGRADSRAADPHEHVRGARRLGHRALDQLERPVILAHEEGSHGAKLSSGATSTSRSSGSSRFASARDDLVEHVRAARR